MRDKVHTAFDSIRADEELIAVTIARLQKKRRRWNGKYKYRAFFKAAVPVAAVILMVFGIVSFRSYFQPESYISLDINPSIELALNKRDRVIATYAFNEEGQIILQKAAIQGKQYPQACEELVKIMGEEGYLEGVELLSISVQTGSWEKEAALNTHFQGMGQELHSQWSGVSVEILTVSAEVREQAHSCHVSPAKYLAIQELMEVDEEADFDQYSSHSIHQIRTRTRQCHADAQQGSQQQAGGYRHGNGHGRR